MGEYCLKFTASQAYRSRCCLNNPRPTKKQACHTHSAYSTTTHFPQLSGGSPCTPVQALPRPREDLSPALGLLAAF